GSRVSLLAELSGFYSVIGDWERTLRYAREALQVLESIDQANRALTINTLASLGRALLKTGDGRGAESLFQRSLALLEQDKVPNTDLLFVSLHGLATIRLEQERLAEAESLLLRGLKVIASHPPTRSSHFSRAFLLGRAAQVYEKQGRLAEAQAAMEESLETRPPRLGSIHTSTAADQLRLARLYVAQGRPGMAVRMAEHTQSAEEEELAAVLACTSETQRLAYLARRGAESSFGVWASVGAVEPLARSVIRIKGVVLDSLLEERRFADARGLSGSERRFAFDPRGPAGGDSAGDHKSLRQHLERMERA